MKKGVSELLIIVLAVSLFGCGGGDSSEKIAPNISTETENLLEGELKGEISVVCYEPIGREEFLNEAAALFEARFPGTKINVNIFAQMPEFKVTEVDGGSVAVSEDRDEAKEVLDYISRVNTELMGGHGDDIIAMDILPYYKYAESGLLEDLSLYMDADVDFDITEYKSNILEATQYKGGQYIMPLDFGFSFYSFDKSKVSAQAQDTLREKDKITYWEMTDLIKEQFANDSSNARVIDYQGKEDALQRLLRIDYKKYIDLENKKANFMDGSFVRFLNELQEQGDSGYFTPAFVSTEEMTKDFIEGQRLYYYHREIAMTMKEIYRPRDDMPESSSIRIPEADEIAGLMLNDAGEAVFGYYQAYGINSNSKNKRLAWEFLKFMIGEEMQESLNLLGDPVNKAAFIEASKVYMLKFPNYVDGYEEFTEEKYVTAYDNYMERYNGFVDALNSCPITDRIITDMVISEAALFFEGSRSAEEAAEALQSKVQLYLNE